MSKEDTVLFHHTKLYTKFETDFRHQTGLGELFLAMAGLRQSYIRSGFPFVYMFSEIVDSGQLRRFVVFYEKHSNVPSVPNLTRPLISL